MTKEKSKDPTVTLPEDEVVKFLKANPDFLAKHPDILEFLLPPRQEEGANVLDFQQYAIKHLQEKVQNVKENFDQVITISRSNISTQYQVNQAVIGLVRANTLEKLLEVITTDMVRTFNVDVVRLGLESELSEAHGAYYPEDQYSGLVFLPHGIVESDLGGGSILMLADQEMPPEISQLLFADCSHLAVSAVLLKLQLPRTGAYGVLAFGAREEGRFDPKQATDMLNFLSRVFEEILDQCLMREDIEP